MHIIYTSAHTAGRGDFMAQNLSELLSISSSTRSYFVSLPVWLQLLLHKEHSNIRTSAQLHFTADILIKQEHLLQSSRRKFF